MKRPLLSHLRRCTFTGACVFLVAMTAAAAPLGKVSDFRLQDIQGAEQTQQSCCGAVATVLVFLGTECPVSNGYAPELTRLAKQFAPRGVRLVGVHCDPDVTRKAAATHAREYGLAFPVLLDPRQTLARASGVTTMPEVAVLLRDGEVVYRGRIDNRYTEEGKRRFEPTTHDLRDAVEAILAGKTPDPAVTKAFGCPIPK